MFGVDLFSVIFPLSGAGTNLKVGALVLCASVWEWGTDPENLVFGCAPPLFGL